MLRKISKLFIINDKNGFSLQFTIIICSILTLLASYKFFDKYILICTTVILAALGFITIFTFLYKHYFKWYIVVIMLLLSGFFTQKLISNDSNQNYLLKLDWNSSELDQFDYIILSYNVDTQWERKSLIDSRTAVWQVSDDFFRHLLYH